MLTCANCEKQVIPTKAFNTGAFILLLVLGAVIGGVAYLIYFSAKASTDCPVCRADVYGRQPVSFTEETVTDPVVRVNVSREVTPGSEVRARLKRR